MKKKLILSLFMTSFACVVLASCNENYGNIASNEVDFSKDFDLARPSRKPSAKLLSQEEKIDFVNKNSNNDFNAFFEAAKEKYKTMVWLAKREMYEKNDDGTTSSRQMYAKTVVDLQTGNSWYYEKWNQTYAGGDGIIDSSSFELETKLVNKDGNYIVRSTLNLDNYQCWGVFIDEYGFENYAPLYYATGNANVYTIIPSDGLVLNIENEIIKQKIDCIMPGVISKEAEEDSISLYIDENQNYIYKERNVQGLAYDIEIQSDNYSGRYANTSINRLYEILTEIYFSEKSIMDDEINIDDCSFYSVQDWTLNETECQLPLVAFPGWSITIEGSGWGQIGGLIGSYAHIPLSFFQDNFSLK